MELATIGFEAGIRIVYMFVLFVDTAIAHQEAAVQRHDTVPINVPNIDIQLLHAITKKCAKHI